MNVKIRVTRRGGRHGIDLVISTSELASLKARNKLSHRANIAREFNNMWYRGTERDFSLWVQCSLKNELSQ